MTAPDAQALSPSGAAAGTPPAAETAAAARPGSALEASVCEAALRRAVQAAAQWFVRLADEPRNHRLRDDWERWLAQDALHECAWERVLNVSRQTAGLPAFTGPLLRRPRPVARRTVVRSLAGLMLLGGTAWLAGDHSGRGAASYRSAVGQQRAVVLDDGTHVLLNTASVLEVASVPGRTQLRLRSGEVLVDTGAAVPGEAPLVLCTAHGELRAGAARFAVRALDTHTRVAVETGELFARAHGLADFVTVPAGMRVRIGSHAVSSAQPLPERTLGWVSGVLMADDMRLDVFLAELARYRQGLVRCDPAVAGLRLTGAFQLADTDAVLALLPAALPVRVSYRTRYWVTVEPAHTQA